MLNWVYNFIHGLPPVQILVFFLIFESFFMLYVSTRLLKIPTTTKQMVTITVIYSIVTYLFRSEMLYRLVTQYGLHVFFLIFTMVLLMIWVLKVPWQVAFVATVIAEILVSLGDAGILTNVMAIFGKMSIQELPKHPLKWIAYGWSEDGLLIVLAILIKTKKDFCLFPIPGIKRNTKN